MNKKEREYPPKFIIVLCKLIGFCISKVFWRIRFSGIENIPKDLPGGLIVAANHQTYFDPVWICLKINRKFRFMAWDRAFDWFVIGGFIQYLGAFPVGLDRRGYVQASRKALQVLKDGATLIIFPEGEREFSDGNLLPFKPGAVRLAMEANVPILPVSIRGGNKIWPQGTRFPRLNKVEIIYHPLLKIEPSVNPKQLQHYAKKMNSILFEIISNR